MPVTDSGAMGHGDHLGTPNRAGLEARAEGVQASAASCVAGGARMEWLVVSRPGHQAFAEPGRYCEAARHRKATSEEP